MSARKATKKQTQTADEPSSEELFSETRASGTDGREQLLKTVSFEGTIQRLGQIVEELEAGELPLEESLRLFEEGVGLARRSQKILETAERRVEQLLRVDQHGVAQTVDLDADE